MGNQTVLSFSILSFPTLVSPQLKLPLYSVLCTSQTVPHEVAIPVGVPDCGAAPWGAGGLCKPTQATQKSHAGPHTTSPISLAVTRAGLCFQKAWMGSETFPSCPQSESPHALEDKSDPSGQFAILQWCIFVDGQMYFGEENAWGEPHFTQVL